MAYPEDLVGKYIRIDLSQAVEYSTARYGAQEVDGIVANQVVAVTTPVYGTAPRMGGHRGGPPVGGGPVNLNQNYNFGFLKYVPGGVSFGPLAPNGLITGPMSGCYLFTYMQNGVRKMAHVGTVDSPADDRSVEAKESWKAFASTTAGLTNIQGFSPFDVVKSVTTQYLTSTMQAPKCIGIFDTAGNAWSALLTAQRPTEVQIPGAGVGETYRVGVVKKVVLQPWSSIAMLRLFAQADGFDARVDPNAFRLGAPRLPVMPTARPNAFQRIKNKFK